jgi:hypothetical protein
MLAYFESYFGPDVTLTEHAVHNPNSVQDYTPPASGVSSDRTTTAYVSGGVWVARCPEAGCRGVEMVRFSDRQFFCCECRNASVGHHPILVELPDEHVAETVDRILELRPVPASRNWRPDESVDDLKRENLMHGVAI